MALADEIQAIRDKTLSALNDAHDYFVYTKEAWRLLQADVKRRRRKFTFRDPSTKSKFSEKDFIALAQRYGTKELASAALQQFLSIFEAFLFDVLHRWISEHPGSLSEREVKIKTIIDLPDKAAIIDAVVRADLESLMRKGPAEWFKYLKSRVKIDSPNDQDSLQFAEVKTTRDVLVHAQGFANPEYIKKGGKAARAQVGEPLSVSEPYLQESWRLVYKLVGEIGSGMAAKSSRIGDAERLTKDSARPSG